MTIQIKRAYDSPVDTDGRRVLVDRLWPRGISKAEAKIDVWLKAVAPSTELRKWFGHDPDKWAEFQEKYEAELATNPALVELKDLASNGMLTLVYAAKDEKRNNAVVLQQILMRDRSR